MRQLINHLRSKPERTRVRIVHLTVIFAGIVLVGVWLVSVGGVITSPANTAQLNMDENLSDSLKPISALKDNFVDGYKSISTTTVEGIE